MVVKTKQKTQLKWHQNWSTVRLQKSPGENENTTSHIRQYNIYNIDQDKKKKRQWRSTPTRIGKKTLTAPNQIVKFLIFLWKHYWTACFWIVNLSSIFLLFSKIFFTESLISFLFESWRRSAAACHKQTSPLCHYAWVRGASLPILLFAFWYASFIFFCFFHFKFQILHLQYAFFRFCIMYFAFYILRFAFAFWPLPFDCSMIYMIWYKPPLSSG